MKKYELTKKTKKTETGEIVYRIRALKSWEVQGRVVNKGDLGGWVQSEDNLSHEGGCWLFDEAMGYQNSRRSGESIGYNNSRQFGNSQQCDHSQQGWYSIQSGNSQQGDYSQQGGYSVQRDHSVQSGYSQQCEKSQQCDYSQQGGWSVQDGDSVQRGNSVQCGRSQQRGHSVQGDYSQQGGFSVHIYNGKFLPDIICLGPFGKNYRYITVQPDLSIVAGCFHGFFEEFRESVVKKYGSDYGGYAPAIIMLTALIGKINEKGAMR